MSEVEKMYENAGIKQDRMCEWVCKDSDFCSPNCEHYESTKLYYPTFTAEKQIEIIKVISTNHISDDYGYKYLGIDRDEIDKEFYLNLCIDGKKYHAHDKDFGIALAKLVNIFWQDLTEQERTQIRSILYG